MATYTRSVVITGGTQNMGYHAALAIAKAHPEYLVVISARSDKKAAAAAINRALGQSNTIFQALDLGSVASVRAYAADWAAAGRPPIQALLLNAGLQFPGALTTTADGLESTFAVNHVGHALLFHLLCPHLAADGVRVVLTGSGTHDPAMKSGLPDAAYTTAEELAHPTAATAANAGRQRYATSKLVNVLWMRAMHRRLQQQERRGISVAVMDPGLMPGSGLAREASPFLRFLWNFVMPHTMPLLRIIYTPNIHTPKESGDALAWFAIDPAASGISGKYFEGRKEIKSSKDSYVESKQDDLWNWTAKYLAQNDEELQRFGHFK